ncbi:MAG: polymer-forming cytoskeletal protein [Actinobacteria bacterium]|nr:polymer-forming cytoskeletal protein [Actinomycetota bacterium]
MFLSNSSGNIKHASPGGHFTKIAKDAKIEGKFNFKGPVIIEGTIIGKVNSEDLITISESGYVESSIKTKDAVICGKFKGEMTVTGMAIIKSTGKFIGNLTQKNGASLS